MCPQRGAPWRVRQSLQSVVCQWNVWQPTEGSVQRSLSINDRIGGHAAPPTEHHQQQRIYLLTYLLPRATDLLTARGVAHLVVHGTSGSTSYETIPPFRMETS